MPEYHAVIEKGGPLPHFHPNLRNGAPDMKGVQAVAGYVSTAQLPLIFKK